MPCGVKTCTVNDDHLLWRCTYCDKKYHAACIGVQRHREHIITAFMVPMCAECQDILKKEADVRKLLYQQDKLLKAMHSQNDTNLRIAADLRKFSLVSALFESIERLLNEVNETLAMVNKNNESIRSAISQHMESCDSRVATVVTDINLSNCTLSQKINNLFEDRLTCLRNDMALLTRNTESLTTSINQASHQSTHDSQLREILEEVKFVSANLSGLKFSNTNDLLPNKTLEEELAEITQINEASMTLEKNWQKIYHGISNRRRRSKQLNNNSQNHSRLVINLPVTPLLSCLLNVEPKCPSKALELHRKMNILLLVGE